MILTDEQVREIALRSVKEVDELDIAMLHTAVADRTTLLADRAALLAEIAELKARMAEGFSARKGQIENGARMIEELRAENAKLRRVVEAARVFRDEGTTLTVCDLGPCQRVNEKRDRSDPQAILYKTLAALEPTNVPDATDDKNRGTQQRGLRGIWSSVE